MSVPDSSTCCKCRAYPILQCIYCLRFYCESCFQRDPFTSEKCPQTPWNENIHAYMRIQEAYR